MWKVTLFFGFRLQNYGINQAKTMIFRRIWRGWKSGPNYGFIGELPKIMGLNTPPYEVKNNVMTSKCVIFWFSCLQNRNNQQNYEINQAKTMIFRRIWRSWKSGPNYGFIGELPKIMGLNTHPMIQCKENKQVFDNLLNVFALVRRGNCDFEEKVHNVQEAGYLGAIIYSAVMNNLWKIFSPENTKSAYFWPRRTTQSITQ